MKHLFILMVLIMPFTLRGQVSGTTLEEYNYLTKGYKIQVESGLDMKKGYTLKKLNDNEGFNYKMKFSALYRDKDTIPCAILVEATIPGLFGNSTDYICVPNHSAEKEIWQKYAGRISANNLGAALAWGLGKCTAFFAKNN
jgi:hypothetical protein